MIATEAQLACPLGHKLPVWGTLTGQFYCRRCGRMYSGPERNHDHNHHGNRDQHKGTRIS